MFFRRFHDFVVMALHNVVLSMWGVLAVVSTLWSVAPLMSLYHGLQLCMTLMVGGLLAVTQPLRDPEDHLCGLADLPGRFAGPYLRWGSRKHQLFRRMGRRFSAQKCPRSHDDAANHVERVLIGCDHPLLCATGFGLSAVMLVKSASGVGYAFHVLCGFRLRAGCLPL